MAKAARQQPAGPAVWVLLAVVAAVTLTGLVVLSGCSQKEKFSPALEGGLGTDSLFASAALGVVAEHSATSADSTGDASASKRLVVANWRGSAARSFLFFSVSPDTTVQVTSAKLFLYATRIEGAADAGTFQLFALADTLVPSGLRWGNMPDAGAEIISFGADLVAEDSVVIDVTDVVTSWASGAATNRGFMIRCRDEFAPPEAIVEFASHEETATRKIISTDTTDINIYPVLRIVSVDQADSVELTEKVALQDTFADTLTVTRPTSELIVANGFPSRSFVKFDYSEIPVQATVTRASLRLNVDVGASSFDSMTVICYAVLDSSSGFGASYGSEGSGSAVLTQHGISENGPIITMDVTPLVQPQISRLVSANYGLLVKSAAETSDLDFVIFVPAGGEGGSAPELEIQYTLPPLPWYER